MFAIVSTSGRQYRVQKGDTITVDRLQANEGDEITLGDVLLVGGDKGLKVGNPTLDGASVVAKVTGHGKGDKVITFKYKRRQRTRRRVGFRAAQTTLEILEIKA